MVILHIKIIVPQHKTKNHSKKIATMAARAAFVGSFLLFLL
jgi:hypothetical protein